MESRQHAFGNTSDVIDLGAGHFMRPIHQLERRAEPIGTPIRPSADSPVTGFMLWHECPDESWRCVYQSDAQAPAFECPICGDKGSIINGEWVKT
jgi:hypothetical protein